MSWPEKGPQNPAGVKPPTPGRAAEVQREVKVDEKGRRYVDDPEVDGGRRYEAPGDAEDARAERLAQRPESADEFKDALQDFGSEAEDDDESEDE